MPLNLLEVIRELLPQPGAPADAEWELNTIFLNFWPDQERNLATFRAKPGCSCRGSIQQAMIKTPDKIGAFLAAIERLRGKTFLKAGETVEPTTTPPKPAVRGPMTANEQLGLGPPRPAPQQPMRHLRGQTRDIVDTPEAYSQLLKDLQLQRLSFTGLTVCPVGEHVLRVYFY